MNDCEVGLREPREWLNAAALMAAAKFDALVKQTLFLSGGVQAITIGVFLGGIPRYMPGRLADLFVASWLALGACIVLCMVFMLGRTAATMSVALKLRKRAGQGRSGAAAVAAPLTLRLFNAVTGLAAFLCCIGGVAMISLAAMGLALASHAPNRAFKTDGFATAAGL